MSVISPAREFTFEDLAFEELVIEELAGGRELPVADTCYFCVCYTPDTEDVVTARLVGQPA
ncbi:hypothetical protein [Kitasatospora sp. NPDC087314]|uniref:hypothetical protein n=1 Tax=Kitasatospora sp. NPDC087314 TaxID=3364068 RepID=UPI00381AB82C